MPRREDDDVARRPGAVSTRTLTLAAGFALAAVATLAVFLTDNPRYLRVAVVAVAWAFVLATFAAGRRGTDRMAAAAREAELHRAYELELEREVAARHEYELELENELRRETQDAMRYELDALRGDIAGLSGLREEVAGVSALRGDIAALSGLRDEVARVAALRDDVAALNSLRQELGQLAELRADMGRLRAELTEQLSSEMLVERIVMRTQASRLPADPARLDGAGRALDGGARWTDDVPPRELTGGWPAVRLDEPRETQQFEQVRVERVGPPPPVPAPADPWRSRSWAPAPAEPRPWDTPVPAPWDVPATSSWPAASLPAAPATSAFTYPAPPPPAVPGPQPPPVFAAEGDRWSSRSLGHEPYRGEPRSRHAADETPVPPPVAEAPPSPLEWLAARSLLDPAPVASLPEVPPRRRRRDDELTDPAAAATEQRPAVPAGPPPVRIDDRGGYRVAVRDSEPGATGPAPAQANRLAEILAENGVSPSSGGRRRRRYRDEDDADDVLARVLGRG